MKTIKLLSAALLVMAACGDNKTRPDAQQRRDASGPDAYCSDCPPAPAIGTTQLDRMGRPAINTALNNAFTPTAMQTTIDAKKDEYNADTNYAAWQTTWGAEFAKNLAIIDVLDGGINGNGLCETGETNALNPTDCPTANQVGAGIGCGNQVMYTGPASATSYAMLAGLLSNDVLYVDTSRGQCAFYLAIEFGVVTGLGNTTCGGRAPAYDVIDFSYSALAMGIRGFSTDGNFTPQFGDMVPPHTDYLSAFPYLGEPH